MSMEAFLQFFYAKYGMISESYALEMIGRPGYPKTYIEATDRLFLERCLSRGSEWISTDNDDDGGIDNDDGIDHDDDYGIDHPC